MLCEIWTYNAVLPNSNMTKTRPVLVYGDDQINDLKIIDIHYCIISSSTTINKYDIEINKDIAREIGLKERSVIKVTKFYTGSKDLLINKIGDLPIELKKEFIKNYENYNMDLLRRLKGNK